MTRLCAVYGVTRAGYYAWRQRPESAHAAQDRDLQQRIQRLFQQHRGTYGSPRIHRALQAEGCAVSRRRVARLMRAAGLRARVVRIYRANPRLHRFYGQHPNRLWTRVATRPNQIWVGDITYLPVVGRWRFLAVVLDQCSRRLLAWTLGRTRDARLTRTVLDAAVRRRRPRAGLVFHSDRGSEYAAQAFRAASRVFEPDVIDGVTTGTSEAVRAGSRLVRIAQSGLLRNYALLLTTMGEPLVIPALNRDGDTLSDLVMQMFGTIAGAESTLLAFAEDGKVAVAMTEAPHGTAPALEGKNVANPMAMILAVASLLGYMQGEPAHVASRAVYESALEAVSDGIRTADLSGHVSTTEFTDEVIRRVRTKIDVWSALADIDR